MINIMLRLFGERALHKAVASGASNNPLDVKLGVALLRDRRVPFKSKILAFGLGVGLLALLLALEVPVEGVATFLAPVLLPLDFAIDGIELVALPVLLMAILVAHVAPRAIVDAIRAERLAAQGAPVVDVTSYETRPAAAPLPAAPVYAGSPHI